MDIFKIEKCAKFDKFILFADADALMARKAGASNSISRKPLLDRAVNKKSLEVQGNKASLKESAFKKPIEEQIEYPDWLMDTMSYVEVEGKYFLNRSRSN